MSKHNELGKKAEILASNFLINKGYEILEYNWRSGHKEIDIISRYQNTIVFVEVKSRSSISFGYPEDFVDEAKKKLLITAANEYLQQFEELTPSRFDIISIIFENEKVKEIQHFEDAFYN